MNVFHRIKAIYHVLLVVAMFMTGLAAFCDDLTVSSFSDYAGQTNIVLQASGNVILSGTNGPLTLPETGGFLSVIAGNEIIVETNLIAPGWALDFQANDIVFLGSVTASSLITQSGGVGLPDLSDSAPPGFTIEGIDVTTNATLAIGGTIQLTNIETNIQDSGGAADTNIPYPSSMGLMVAINGNGSVLTNFNEKLLVIGHHYQMTAIPGPGCLFSNWSGTITSSSPTFKFVMQTNLVLEANFVTNLFLAAHGCYRGLFAPTNMAREQTNSGAFAFSLTTNGVLSGKLQLGELALPFEGKFGIDGTATILLTRRGLPATTIALMLDLTNNAVTGSVSNGGFVAALSGDQDIFNNHTNATNYEGRYTLILPGVTNPALGPFGTGYAKVTVSGAGNITLCGSLADGTAISQASVVSKDGFWPFYLALYRGEGSIWAWNYFTNHQIISMPAASWINATHATKSALYSSGFTNQDCMVFGALYLKSAEPLLDLTNASIVLDGGNLPFATTNTVTLASNGKIKTTGDAENTNNLVLTINKAVGSISGSFQDPLNPTRTVKVNGVLLQGETNAVGYFLGTNQSGLFQLIQQ